MSRLSEAYAIPLSILLSIAVPVFWFSYRIVEINNDHQYYIVGKWILGMLFGDRKSFGSMRELSIEEHKTKPTIYSLPNKEKLRTDFTYKLFAVFEDEERLFLVSHPQKKTLDVKAQQIAKKLGLQVDI
ncbi:MAG: hypothetical protein AAF789_04795 [Bacteroidota bacterium]